MILNNNESKNSRLSLCQSGISLVEILVSIVLLGVIASFIALAIPTSISLTGRTNKMETTSVLAQKYIEDVKAKLASDPSLFDAFEDGNTPPIDIEDKHTNNNNYSIQTELTINNTTEIDSVTVPCLVTLTLTVTPKDGDTILTNSDQKVSVSTLLRRDR